jgi:hypothetical protein
VPEALHVALLPKRPFYFYSSPAHVPAPQIQHKGKKLSIVVFKDNEYIDRMNSNPPGSRPTLARAVARDDLSCREPSKVTGLTSLEKGVWHP